MATIDLVVGGPSRESMGDYEYDRADVFEIEKEEEGHSYNESLRLKNKSLEERIDKIENGLHTVHVIDKVIKITTLSTPEIKDRTWFWGTRTIALIILGLSLTVIGFIATVGATTATAAAAEKKDIAALIGFVTITVASIGGLILGLFSSYRGYQGRVQWSQWRQNHPMQIAKERSDAFEKGFLKIMKEDKKLASKPALYQTILTNNELRGLHHSYFTHFNEALAKEQDEKKKIILMTRAVNEGPFSSSCLSYAKVPEEQIKTLAPLIEEYKKFIVTYRQIDKILRELKKNANEEAKKEIDALKDLAKKDRKNSKEHQECIKKIETERNRYLKSLSKDGALRDLYIGMQALHQEAYKVIDGRSKEAALPKFQWSPPPFICLKFIELSIGSQAA